MTKEDLGQIRQVVRDEIDNRIAPLDQRVSGLDEKLGTLDQKVDSLDRKVDSLDRKVHYFGQKIDQKHREMLAKFDQFKQMESEDVIAVAQDAEDLKLRVTKLETGRA